MTEERSSFEDAIRDFNARQNKVISVREALRAQPNESYNVFGMISSMSPVFRMITAQKFRCNRCQIDDEHKLKVALSQEPDGLKEQCKNCGGNMQPGDYVYIPTVSVELMDVDSFSDIERLPVLLFGEEDTKDINIGERVTVKGRLHIIQNRRKGKFFQAIHADYIRYETRDTVELTPKDVEAIKRFASKKGNDLVRWLVKMHSPEIIGYDFIKEGLLQVEVYAGPDIDSRERKRIHTALVGPAGLAKTKLLKASVRHVPNSRYESGQHSSGKSLTAMVAREDEMHLLRLGPIPLARGSVVAINEAGRMSEDDQALLLDAMEEGTFSMNKFGFNAKIQADASVIMSANPRSSDWVSTGGDDKVSLDEIPALKELLDRSDLIFAVKAVRDEETIRKYAELKGEMEDRDIANYDLFLRKYIQYAKAVNPVISEEAKNILNEAYVRLATRFGSPRVRNTLFRLARARARLKLKPVVDDADAKETISFYNSMIQQFTDILTVPESPHDVAYRIMVDVLRNSTLAILLSDLARKASEQNQQVEAYLKGGRDIGSNNKLRRIHSSLVNHSQIKQVQDKPIALQWFESKEQANSQCLLSDTSDLSVARKQVNKGKKTSKNPDTADISATDTSDTSDRKQKQPGKSAYEAWVAAASIRADLKKEFEVPCPLCDYKFSNPIPDAAIYAVAVTHGSTKHPDQNVKEMLREKGYVTPTSVNNADGHYDHRDDDAQKAGSDTSDAEEGPQ
jgi:replicative DNA helicase Mcm